MKKSTVTKLVALIFLSLLGTNQAWAHTSLAESTPSDGAMLMQSPELLHLKFTENVRLLKVAVMLGENEIDIDFEPITTAATEFAVTLPNLEHGHYNIAWSVMGADSHNVKGELTFMVGMMTDHNQEHGDTGHTSHDQNLDHGVQATPSGHDH